MSRKRFAILVVAAVLVISAALFLSMHRNASHDKRIALLFPSLPAGSSTVTSVEIRKAQAKPNVSLQQKGGHWTVAQRDDYPADMVKLRKLLLALGDARIIEEKTSDPANYAVIGVGDPGAVTATGTQVTFTLNDGLHSVIVGKASGEGNFVRRGDERPSYLVSPGIYVDSEPRYWIDGKIVDISPDDITRIDYKPPAGASYAIHRVASTAPAIPSAPPGTTNAPKSSPVPPEHATVQFALDGLPDGRKAADSQTLEPSAAVLGSITADDVAATASLDFKSPFVAVITLKSGQTITLTGAVIGDRHWIQVSAPQNDTLTLRAAGRAFEVAGYRYDGLFRNLDGLLVPKLPPSKAPSAKKP